MDELACLMDWDLEAIVSGCNGEAPAAATINMDDPHLNFSHFFSEQDEILCSFPEFSETTKVFDELEELYKPFYPVLHPLSTQSIVTSSLSIPKEPQDSKVVLKGSEKVTIQDLLVPTVSKCKRSKNKNKNNKVVKQVTAADGVCDSWAWRKYGQKPIKGSPYPRSYYRCSSSKGCLARKQVERSQLDPAVFLVTYRAEHNHPYPTRRSSLAGSTRKKNFIVAPPRSTSDQNPSSSSSSSSGSSAVVLSPRTPLVVQSIKDEVLMMKGVQQSKGLKKEEDFFEFLDEGESVELLGDGWFSSTELEELMTGLDQQLALDGCNMLLDS